MKNTLENKAKFFAQYWGQNILRYEPDLGYHRIVNDYKIGNADEFVAELKPLSQITDEDATEIFKHLAGSNIEVGDYEVQENKKGYFNQLDSDQYILFENEGFESYFDDLQLKEDYNKILFVFDYLRSKGYALPYMGISVEQQIEWGWIKLKQQ